ncbi:unnamed protein product [Rotaria sordida]|uniref:Uncharacterized protein n=1 Tax=Rotaria sordida TaxID=392033 RepID=A0A818NRT2_9BILA|nr:unnamed protein product [Rotaria sordida]CAF1111797.1 unnamed protein product [Rotaria sordida]CAF1142411.1 unnamed protein product [Rotaria sordida]CAF3608223.1 unnamed protein product [Rotaria sordida]CAF3632621.1 unnamed protein product [Rotaria sordida]
MPIESNTSSLIWDSSSSPLQFQSSSLSNIPTYYNRSLIAPLTLTQRKRNSHSTNIKLPPLKLRSTLTWPSSDEENFFNQSKSSSEQELNLFKQKFDRLRASLSQSLQVSRHTFDKVHYHKTNVQQTCVERGQFIDQLMATSIELNNKLKELKNQIINQRHIRDNHEMRQLKLQRTLIRLNNTKDRSLETLKTSDKSKFIEQYNSLLLQIKNQYQQEIADRDNEIEELKEKLFEDFNYQADEHMKLLRATLQAFNSESQKRDVLQEYVDAYETNVYRARKPCCVSTSHRLCQVSTQLRLYLIIELALRELFHSSCSCGQFKRSYQTYMRLHKK